nr:MAG TPA: hypothetical protein [Caudoviricetes sp.]
MLNIKKQDMERVDSVIHSLLHIRAITTDIATNYRLSRESNPYSPVKLSLPVTALVVVDEDEYIDPSKTIIYLKNHIGDIRKKDYVGDFLLWINLLPRQEQVGTRMLFVLKRRLQSFLRTFVYLRCLEITKLYSPECTKLLEGKDFYSFLQYYNQVSSRYQLEYWARQAYDEICWLVEFMMGITFDKVDIQSKVASVTVLLNIEYEGEAKHENKVTRFSLDSISKMFKRKKK